MEKYFLAVGSVRVLINTNRFSLQENCEQVKTIKVMITLYTDKGGEIQKDRKQLTVTYVETFCNPCKVKFYLKEIYELNDDYKL